MMVRCVPSVHGDPVNSSLAPSLRKFWDLEFLEPDIIYPDFNSMKESKEDKWKKLFRFTLESSDLEDFSGQMTALQGQGLLRSLLRPTPFHFLKSMSLKVGSDIERF